MYKTKFHIKEMDCPSEERLIELTLSDISSVKKLSFDLEVRELTVYHDGDLKRIKPKLKSLNLGSTLINTMKYRGTLSPNTDNLDKKLLWTVLVINLSFFIIEIIFGVVAESLGLVADSLDMLADTFVYGLSIYAIAGTLLIKKRIAKISGIFQLLLATLGFMEVIRRFILSDATPNSLIMISISILALVANTVSLIILNKSKNKEVHIKSSQIFTSNDVIANIGVIIAGVLVFTLESKIPDLIIGSIVFLLVFRGALRILKLSK